MREATDKYIRYAGSSGEKMYEGEMVFVNMIMTAKQALKHQDYDEFVKNCEQFEKFKRQFTNNVN